MKLLVEHNTILVINYKASKVNSQGIKTIKQLIANNKIIKQLIPNHQIIKL